MRPERYTPPTASEGAPRPGNRTDRNIWWAWDPDDNEYRRRILAYLLDHAPGAYSPGAIAHETGLWIRGTAEVCARLHTEGLLDDWAASTAYALTIPAPTTEEQR